MNSDAVVTDPSQVEIDWLDRVLVQSGAIQQGKVRDFSIKAEGSDNAHIARIKIEYEQDAIGKLPTRLFLKMCAGGSDIAGISEVNYYARDYVQLANSPIPTCYQAQYSTETGAYHILMDDLSETHRNNWRTKPTLDYGLAVARALAAIHAHRWGTDKISEVDGAIPSRDRIECYINHVRQGLLPMLATIRAEIEPAWELALIDLFTNHPRVMLERTKNDNGFTLIHGDVNPGNILSPLNGNGKTYLIDRQPFERSLTTWLGVSDIAYMMVHWWKTNLRRKFEMPILREYHESLIRNGVSSYSWEQLIEDYKIAAVQSIYIATQWCIYEKERAEMKWVWFPQLQKSMAAFFDLHCADLWSK